MKKLAEGEWSLSSYEAEANVLILKGKALKINSLFDVLDEDISSYEVVLEECRMQHENTEDECAFYLQGLGQEQQKYKNLVEEYQMKVSMDNLTKMLPRDHQGHTVETTALKDIG